MNESQLTRKVVRILKQKFAQDIWFYKVNDNFTSGLPDLIICYHGKFIGMELKVGKNKPTTLQRYTGKQIFNAGGYYFICYNIENVLRALGSIERR